MKKLVFLVILLLTAVFIAGCGEEARVVTSDPKTVTTTTTTTTTTKTVSTSSFDDAVEHCESAVDKNSCYVDAVTLYTDKITDQNLYAYVNVCKRILSSVENPEFDADDFDWEIYPTLRLQCFRQFQEPFWLYGNADFVAKELCDDLEGYGIANDEQYTDYCYIEVAEARKYEDTQGAEELCYTMDNTLLRKHCCQTVYGKYNNQEDHCTKVRV